MWAYPQNCPQIKDNIWQVKLRNQMHIWESVFVTHTQLSPHLSEANTLLLPPKAFFKHQPSPFSGFDQGTGVSFAFFHYTIENILYKTALNIRKKRKSLQLNPEGTVKLSDKTETVAHFLFFFFPSYLKVNTIKSK